jgi:hypothetical protein
VNTLKYNQCVKNSFNSNLYGYSWFLDIVADNWYVLILEDYKAVMPIPWSQKFGLKYALQPYFCQQLGIFSSVKLNQKTINLFFSKIPSHIIYLNLSINDFYTSNNLTYSIKTNYSINLNKKYEILYNNYRKDRKKSLKKAFKAKLTFENTNNKNSLIQLYKNTFQHLKLPNKYYSVISNLIDFCLEKEKGFIREVYCENSLICSGFFIKQRNRNYYIFSASSLEGKKVGATTFLIDSVIREFSNSQYIYDFEGSNIKSVASFYKSFGSQPNYYNNYTSNAIKNFFI